MTKYLYLAVLLLAGCATTESPPSFNVGVSAYARSGVESQRTFVLLPAEKGVSIDDLQFAEFAVYIERAMYARGYRKAEGFQSADLAVFVEYGIGEPQENKYSYRLPVWGQTGVSSSTTTGNVNVYGSTANYSQTTTNTPTYGVKGYTSHQGTYTTFTRRLFLTAYDLGEYRQNGAERVVWETKVASTGRSGDLRFVFPILVAAGRPYIGVSTGKIVDVILAETDAPVLEVKGIVVESKTKKK
jgi:hypothetical protein